MGVVLARECLAWRWRADDCVVRVQLGDEPSSEDLVIGMMISSVLTAEIVRAHNAQLEWLA